MTLEAFLDSAWNDHARALGWHERVDADEKAWCAGNLAELGA